MSTLRIMVGIGTFYKTNISWKPDFCVVNPNHSILESFAAGATENNFTAVFFPETPE